MAVSRTFFRVTAVASILAVVAVLLAQLVLTGYPRAGSPDEIMAVYTHPVFRAQRWVIFVQVALMFLALWGATLKAYRFAPGLILTGLVFFVFWQILEIVPRSIDLMAIGYGWAPEFLASEDPSERTRLLNATRQAAAISGALGVGRRVVWALGHLMFGLAFWKGSRLMKGAGAFFLLTFLRLALRMVGEATGRSWITSLGGGSIGFVVTMVPLFAILGWWLWREPAVIEG